MFLYFVNISIFEYSYAYIAYCIYTYKYGLIIYIIYMTYRVVVEGLEDPVVPLGVVHAEGGEQLEHLLLHLHTARVQG